MTNHYDTIRAALEAAIAYPNSTHAELKADAALAALAELEREPTPEECKVIAHMMIGLFNKLGKDQPSTPEDTVARVIFPAVRAVMGGGS